MLIFRLVWLILADVWAVVIEFSRAPTVAETLLKFVIELPICAMAGPIAVASCPLLAVGELRVLIRLVRAPKALVVPAGLIVNASPVAGLPLTLTWAPLNEMVSPSALVLVVSFLSLLCVCWFLVGFVLVFVLLFF